MPRVYVLLVAIPFLAIAASCGDDPATTPPPPDDGGPPVTVDGAPPPDAEVPNYDPSGRSGTRLRRRYIESGPGAYRTIDFWDNELKFACAFKIAADGQLRCLPRRFDLVFYPGAGCTSAERVMNPETPSCNDEFGRPDDNDTIYRRTTTTRTLVDGQYSSRSGAGACSTVAVAPNTTAFVVEAIPFARFVPGNTSDEPRSGGMSARFADGADGSRMLLSVRDTTRNVVCDLVSTPGRCVPPRTAPFRAFSNSGCTVPLAVTFDNNVPDVLVQDLTDANSCTIGKDYYAVGAEVALATLYERNTAGACVSFTPPPSNHYYARGAAIPLSSFPEVKVRQEGTGPIQARRFADVDDKPLGQAHAFWDSQGAFEGAAAKLADGSLRFLPNGVARYRTDNFSDTGCSTSPLGSHNCEANEAPYVRRDALLFACDLDYFAYETIYARGAQHTGTYYFSQNGSPCVARQPLPSFRYFNLGAPVPSSTFPELFVKTE